MTARMLVADVVKGGSILCDLLNDEQAIQVHPNIMAMSY
jgi:hypothetical protein